MSVFDKMNRFKLVWNLFDDTSSLGKAILGRLSTVIDGLTQGKGLPFFYEISKEVDPAEELWYEVRFALDSMVVSRVENKDIDEIRKGCKLSGESDLAFLIRMHLHFQAMCRHEE